MFIFRVFLMALRSLRANLLRSLLATLGVIIGVGAVISANAILSGFEKDFRERFEAIGANQIFVVPGVARRGGQVVGAFQTLQLEDVDAIKEQGEFIKGIVPDVTRVGRIKYFSKNEQAQIVGTDPAYAQLFNLTLSYGRFIDTADVGGQRRVAVLGHQVAASLFGEGHPVGRKVKVGMTKLTGFEVIGVLDKKGQKGFRNMDDQVIIPVSTAQKAVFGVNFLDSIMIQATAPDKMASMTQGVKKTLRQAHRIRAGTTDDFTVVNPEELQGQVNDFMRIWARVLYMISGISLVVGGIGIMNIMLVSVTERTREIGVRIAVGARAADILQQFLLESSVISFGGGALGVFAGIALADLMTQLSSNLVLTHVTLDAVIVALLVAVFVGMVSGIYPAYKASQLDPVEALRFE